MSLDVALSVIGILLTPFSWLSAFILWRAGKAAPRIGALNERTRIAVAIMVMLTSGAAISLNRFTGYSLFPIEIARFVFLGSLIVLGLVPVSWVYLWFRGRLGQM